MLRIYRYTSDLLGTRGIITFDGKVICHSLELPWRDNRVGESCIPEGNYQGLKRRSEKFGDVLAVKYVRGRSGILFHPGNTIDDSRGCILPGLDVYYEGVLHSQLAMKRLLAAVPNTFDIVIEGE